MNTTRFAVCVLVVATSFVSGCHTPGGGALRCKCFDHLPRDRKWIFHHYFEPQRYDYHTTCWNPMMYDPCTCCWGPGMPGEYVVEQGQPVPGEVIDAPEPSTADPMELPDPVPALPPLDAQPPSLDAPDEGGVIVPDLGESLPDPLSESPLILPASFHAHNARQDDGAPILQRIPPSE